MIQIAMRIHNSRNKNELKNKHKTSMALRPQSLKKMEKLKDDNLIKGWSLRGNKYQRILALSIINKKH